MGLGAWTPIVPGKQRGRPVWIAAGVLWSVIAFAGWVLAVVNDGGAGGGLLIILGWVGGLATALTIRPAYASETATSFAREREAAEQRLAERREGQRMAAEQPDLAVELGIGRPDKPGARAAGLVDVNNASAAALTTLPGIDEALATRIVELRTELNGFASVHELGGLIDLDGNAVERLEDRVVFLPR
jgi:DNA uptake protein ComE-like DNA-binding protein